MNMNRLIGMILRPIINRGVNAGIDAVTRKHGPSDGEDRGDTDSPESREAARRAKQTLRTTRRLTRM